MDELREWEWSTRDMYRRSIGVHEPSPRSYPQVSRAFQSLPRGGARRGFYHDSYGFDPRIRGFEFQCFGRSHFSLRGSRPQRTSVDLHTSAFTTSGQMTQYWISKKFMTNPSTDTFTYYSSRM